MARITLTPEDAAAIGRVIEQGAARQIADGPQLDAALLVAHKLLVSNGPVLIETEAHDAA